MPGHRGVPELEKDKHIPATSPSLEMPASGSWRGSQPGNVSSPHGRASSGGTSQMVELPFAGFIFMYCGLDESP